MFAGFGVEVVLDFFEQLLRLAFNVGFFDEALLLGVASDHDDLLLFEVSGADFDAYRDAFEFPLVEFPAWRVLASVVQDDA